MKGKDLEICVGAPDGYYLVGVRTVDNTAILVWRPKASEIRQIGFVPEPAEDESDESDDEE